MDRYVFVGWLLDLTKWLWEVVKAVWQSVVDFVDDLFVTILEKTLAVVFHALNIVSIPDFMRDHSIGALLGEAGSTILWFVHILRINDALMVIGVAMIFFVKRKLMLSRSW